MVNGTLVDFKASFLLIGTDDVKNWCDGGPFIVPLETEEDFNKNGLDYWKFANMKVGDIEEYLDDYDGTYLIRMR